MKEVREFALSHICSGWCSMIAARRLSLPWAVLVLFWTAGYAGGSGSPASTASNMQGALMVK
jgi:hypothetical protein